mgnify:CR=1 FL=1
MSSILLTPALGALGAVKLAKASLMLPAPPPTPVTWVGYAAIISTQLGVVSGLIGGLSGALTPSGAIAPPYKVNITACQLALATVASTTAIVTALTAAAALAVVPVTAVAGLATFNATLPTLSVSLTTLETQIDMTLLKTQLA